MKKTILAAALVLAAVAAMPAGARVDATPGSWCGGSLWKLMTLSDAGRNAVTWAPAQTSVADIAKLAAPARVTAARTAFEKQVWQLPNIVVERWRAQSNGEIALELFDTQTSTYMNAYLPNPRCLSKATRGRAGIVAARNALTSVCPAPTGDWQILGASVSLSGVGFWNPVKTTLGALPNGAELRPVTALRFLGGCGH